MCAAAALLTGCGQPTGENVLPYGNQSNAANAAATHIERSWMEPAAQQQDLIYVSNAASSINVYGFSSHRLLGKLTGINDPYGLCSDTSGDVWVVGWGKNQLIEYAHGSTKRLRTLSVGNPSANLYACSVDPVTGDLAVTNWGADNWYQGNVYVFRRASGQPASYLSYGIWFFYGCSYDQQGNLWVNGWDAYRNAFAVIGELPKGANKMRAYTLNPNLQPTILGAIQWDGRYVAMADLGWLYEYEIQGSQAILKGYTPLTYHYPLGMFWITTLGGKRQIIAPDSAGKPFALQYWTYPQGGNPNTTITDGLDGAYGVTVSAAKGS
jgi:hypothetical protein